jgi:hypothetical protein
MSIRAVVFIAALAATGAIVQPALAQENVKVGALRCEVSGGLGLIIASSKQMECRFTSARGHTEHYYGTIQKFGLDIGATNRGTLAWDVFAPTEGPKRHALAGDYVGVGASATVGAGLGANALIGGSERSFTLQPLSIQTQTGLDLAAGVSSMTLRPGRA